MFIAGPDVKLFFTERLIISFFDLSPVFGGRDIAGLLPRPPVLVGMGFDRPLIHYDLFFPRLCLLARYPAYARSALALLLYIGFPDPIAHLFPTFRTGMTTSMSFYSEYIRADPYRADVGLFPFW